MASRHRPSLWPSAVATAGTSISNVAGTMSALSRSGCIALRINNRCRRLGLLATLVLMAMLVGSSFNAEASPLRVVAIGASNTSGWGVGAQSSYPAQLERLLRAKGIDAQVTNAGMPFD